MTSSRPFSRTSRSLCYAFALTLPLLAPLAPVYSDTAVGPAQGVAAPLAAVVAKTPGLHREAGWWLFNGSPWVYASEDGGDGPLLFTPNLTRAGTAKLPFDAPATAGVLSHWATVALPPLTEMCRPGYDFDGMTQRLRKRLSDMHGTYIGFALPSRSGGPSFASGEDVTFDNGKAPGAGADLSRSDSGELSGDGAALMARLRAVLASVAPGAALILRVPVDRDATQAGRDILFAGEKADALWLDYQGGRQTLWPLKVARRTVEEQPNYDLPIFVSLASDGNQPGAENDFGPRGFASYCLMSGATGIIQQAAKTVSPPAESLIESNLKLFLGAVTLEDAAIYPSKNTSAERLDALLRVGGRVPLLGKLESDPKSKAQPESVLIQLDNATDALTLEELKVDAAHGATLYLEGTPDLSKPDLLAAMQDLSGCKVALLPRPQANSLTLMDPWTFGSLHDRELTVTQTVTLTPRPSLAAQTKSEPGMDKLIAPRFVGKLATDPNGLVVYGVGKGRVIWNPQTIVPGNSDALLAGYYAAISGAMQGALLKVEAQSAGNPVMLKTALRLTRNRTALVGLFNDSVLPADATVTFRGVPGLVIDVATGKTLDFAKAGNEAAIKTTVPANGWTLLALPDSQKAYDADKAGELPGGKGKKKR